MDGLQNGPPWLAKLKAEGKPIPCGRKRGGHNRSIAEREQAAWEKQCLPEWRDASCQNRSHRKKRRDMSGRLLPI
jgi:hypothetical protein